MKRSSLCGCLFVCFGLLVAGPSWGQFDEPDSSATDRFGWDSADSLAFDSTTGLVAETPTMPGAPEGAGLVTSWMRETRAEVTAEVRKVGYKGDLTSDLTLSQQAKLTKRASISTEDFRKQDKTVDRRNGSVIYSSGKSLPFTASLRLSEDWSEDRTATTAGQSNLNKRDMKQAVLNLTKTEILTGVFKHGIFLDGSFNDQKGESQQQRNDFSEGSYAGAVRSSVEPIAGLVVATSLYGRKTGGDRSLGNSTSSSSADQDSLAAGVYFARGSWHSSFSTRRAGYSKRYLDWRRNTSGLIDTVGVSEIEKTVEELERKDARRLQMDHQMHFGRVGFKSSVARDLDEGSYRVSNAGRKEGRQDRFDMDLSYRYAGKDSLVLSYAYLWRWDDQQIKDSTIPRGKQIQKRRDVGLRMLHNLFANTKLTVEYNASLSQDIAERQFNENDRDRLETNAKIQMVSNWAQKFRTSMTMAYRHVEDLSIRASRSANNNQKDTYELTPGYYWPIASWLNLQQNFRISIQFTDFLFSNAPTVNKDDDYNKRGNLNTKVVIRPSQRLTFAVSHDYNAKFNATQTFSDATGNDFYRRDLEQTISRIDLSLQYQATDWLKLDGASYRSKDLKDSFGTRTTSSDKRSGELWLGANVSKSWGSRSHPVTLSAALRKYEAFGPNVQESNARYWDADVSVSWRF